MCMQCLATATSTLGVAAGFRAWLAASRPAWITPHRMRVTTAVLLALGVVAAGITA
jgi:hypothetical protein